MSDFSEIFNECIKSKDTKDFDKNLEQLFLISDIQNMIHSLINDYCVTEDYVKNKIQEYFNDREHQYKRELRLETFSNYIKGLIRDDIKDVKDDEENSKQRLCNSFISRYTNQDVNDEYCTESKVKGIQIINLIFDIVDEERIDGKTFLKSLTQAAGLENKSIQRIKSEIGTLNKTYPKVMRALVNKLVSFSVYTKLIECIMENQKLNVQDLILDFNKVRDYLTILLNDNPRTKDEFIEKCNWKRVSSYEKEIFRISSLFGIQRGKFIESKKELEKFKPNDFAKIYDIHSVSNLMANFMILDILQSEKKESTKFRLKDIMDKLSSQIKSEIAIRTDLKRNVEKQKEKNDFDPIMRFKKYTILPRIKEMEEYGFISVDEDRKDRYSLKVKFLKDEQKNALKYAVPFFCGVYPFASIGHFLANRLDSKDLFEFKSFNVANILDDCITYNLLEAINNKKTVKFVLKDKSGCEEFIPEELFIEIKTNLLKVRGNKKEYYLRDIAGFAKDKPSSKMNSGKNYSIESPVFSEIYCFYYKVFEDSIREYKRAQKKQSDYTNCIPEKYTKAYNKMINNSTFKRTFNRLLPILAKLENYTVPLTTLELRWLKTIMQDARFDLFVSDDEKTCLETLVADIEPFDLSSFKIYDNKAKAYKNITDTSIPKGIDKDLLKKQLIELNTFLFSIHDNTIKIS